MKLFCDSICPTHKNKMEHLIGLFTIAFAVHVSLGDNIAKITFYQSQMS